MSHAVAPAPDGPLDAVALRAALGGVVARLEVVARTGSTNADLAAAARAGAPDRTVLVAELQEAGRGRLDRRWISPAGAGLTFSVLLRPAEVASDRWGWLPLMAGLSLLRTVRSLAPGVDAALKWPNDLLLGPRGAKGAGLLAEAVSSEAPYEAPYEAFYEAFYEMPGEAGPAVVLGIGLNVRARPDQLPEAVSATSLLIEGADVRREDVLVALLRRLLADESAWRAAGGDPEAVGLLADYRSECATLGARVRIERPSGVLEGTAVDVDVHGRLVVRSDAGGTCAVAAGDVVHVRS